MKPDSPTPVPEPPKPTPNLWTRHCDVEYVHPLDGSPMLLPAVKGVPIDKGHHPTLQEAIDANLDAGNLPMVAWLSKHL